MGETIFFRPIQPDEIEQASSMVMDVFMDTVAHTYTNEGIATFCRYIDPEMFTYRLEHNHSALVALNREHICGIIEVRNSNHISLFFVESLYQSLGIGKALFDAVLDIIEESEKDVRTIDVRASLNSVGFYEKLGFTRNGEEAVESGMKYIPMVYRYVDPETE